MLTIKEQLTKLQETRYQIISKMNKNFLTESSQKDFIEKLKNIEIQIAKLNKLEDSETNLHTIWIGILSKDEFDNIKLWAKYNSDYKIHIWTDLNHILAHTLGTIISKNVKKINNKITYDFQKEANLKDEFYQNYQSKNPSNTFNKNAKQFLIDKNYASEKEILNWLKEGKEKINEAVGEIKKYTNSEVILHDVAIEKDIFPTTKYYEGYLNTLEHLHIAAGASDRLRYAILNKYGGVYLDTDLMLNFNLEEIKKNKSLVNLINSIENNYYNDANWINEKLKIITNQMIIFDCLNLLNNNEKLSDFAKKWKKHYGGDFDKNFKIFKNISKEFQNLNLVPYMQLSEVPIRNFFQTIFLIDEEIVPNQQSISNALLISKKNSKFLSELMQKIEATDDKLKTMDTHIKLINKKEMILHHTGPTCIDFTTQEIDKNYFFQLHKWCKIANLITIDGTSSSWICPFEHEDEIKDSNVLKSLFWSDKEETKNYFKNVHLQAKKFQNLTIEEERE